MFRANLWLSIACALVVLAGFMPARLCADYPKPSPYKIAWELDLAHSKPKRITVKAPGDDQPVAYWYMTYHVVNNTSLDKILFLPVFELETEAGLVIRSDNNIPPAVFDAVKRAERQMKFLQNANSTTGYDIRQGEDQSKDGVAIWREPNPRMGVFSIYFTGFSGEIKVIKEDDKDVTLRKTLQLTYRQSSDEKHPGEGDLTELESQYIMR